MTIIATCGHEVQTVTEGHVTTKDCTREGEPAVSYQVLCPECLRYYEKQCAVLHTDAERAAWLEEGAMSENVSDIRTADNAGPATISWEAEAYTQRQRLALADELAHEADIAVGEMWGKEKYVRTYSTLASAITRYRSGGPSVYALAQKAMSSLKRYYDLAAQQIAQEQIDQAYAQFEQDRFDWLAAMKEAGQDAIQNPA